MIPQSQTFLKFSDIGFDELSHSRGVCNYCLTAVCLGGFAVEREAKGLRWHEVPINTSSTKRPSSPTWQGQQRGSTLYNTVVQQLRESLLQLPLTEDCRPGSGMKSIFSIHTKRKTAQTCFLLNESIFQGSSKALQLFFFFLALQQSSAMLHFCRVPVKSCISFVNTTTKILG